MSTQTAWHRYGPAYRDPDPHCRSSCLLPGSWFPSEAPPAAPSTPLNLKGSFPAGRGMWCPSRCWPTRGPHLLGDCSTVGSCLSPPASSPPCTRGASGAAGSFEQCFWSHLFICMSRPLPLASLKQQHLFVDKPESERGGLFKVQTLAFCQGQSLSRQSHTSALGGSSAG